MRTFKLPRRLVNIVYALMVVSILTTVSYGKDHKDYTDCAVMGEIFYQLAAFRLQGYPRHLAEESVREWTAPKSWQEKHIYMVKWVYVQGAHPVFAKAEAIAYCTTGVRPELTNPDKYKPPQRVPKAPDQTVKYYLLAAPQVLTCT